MLKAYRVHTQIPADGRLTLDNLPFAAGEEVELIVLGTVHAESDASRYALRGTPTTHLNPTSALDGSVEEEPRTGERIPRSARGLFVVPDDFDAPVSE